MPPSPEPLTITCADGVAISGHFWRPAGPTLAVVIVNSATGVLSSYYHRYAAFLADHGLSALTYDYRGIGASRPQRLRGCGHRWSDWGEFDFAAVLDEAGRREPGRPILVVGHSIGGFLPGMAPNADRIDRMVTVGAQFAWWGDYAPESRVSFLLKWHLAVPVLTSVFGYFPGRWLGWLEDLPAGVALEWAFRRRHAEANVRRELRPRMRERFARVTAPITAISVSDDPFGTARAVSRALDYYVGAPRQLVELRPSDLRVDSIGHFGLFHDRHQAFWRRTLDWLWIGGSHAGTAFPRVRA